jgi:cytochrome c oxidase subunit II
VDEANHFRRVSLIWLIASIILTPVVVLVLGPVMAPGNGSVEASGQVVDNTVLLGISTPVSLAIVVFFIYCFIVFREREPQAALEGPPLRGHAGAQVTWIAVTATLVLFLAGYGSVRLLVDGSGGGQGPNPIAAPAGSGHALEVQVIGQQWHFTYRYPSFGGVETDQLEIPAHTLIAFNVTSLDVIHSFWAYQLGVKADANPGVNNIAYVTTKQPLNFDVHCAELCGVWHGYMFAHGRVVTKSAFAAWIAEQRARFAPIQKSLPPYSKTYFPDPQRRAG